MKKSISFLLTIVLILSQAMPPVLAVKNLEEDSFHTLEMDQIEAEGNGTIGNLLADTIENELEKKSVEDGVDPDCEVLDVSVDGNMAEVSFRTDRDAELIVAIYDEDYIEMYTQGSAFVTSDETEKSIPLEIEKKDMPGFFGVQVFLVEPEGKRPLCIAHKCNHYTKKMQEFLHASIDDFPERTVVNFDSDSTNNFAVFTEGAILIDEKNSNCTGTKNTDGTYTFTNAPDELCKASVGDIIGYRSSTGEILAIKIKNVDIDQTTVHIYEEDVELGELFSYIKIDTDMEAVSEPEKNEISAMAENSVKSGEVEAPLVWNFNFADLPILESQKDDENEIKVTGDIKVELVSHFTYFYDFNLFKEDIYEVEFELEYNVELDLGLTGKGRIKAGFDIPAFTAFGIVNVTLKPSIVLQFTAELSFKAPFKGSFGVSETSDNGFKNISKKPQFTPQIEVEGTIFVGLALSPSLNALSGKALDMNIEGTAGTTIESKKSTDNIKNNKIHSCGLLCLSGEISYHVKFGYEVKIANLKRLTFSNEVDWQIGEKVPFHYSMKYKEFAFSECPHEAYKIHVYAYSGDRPAKPLDKVTISCQGGTLFVRQGTIVQEKDSVTTNSLGKAEIFLPAQNYTIKAAYGKDVEGASKISVKKDAQNLFIYLNVFLDDQQNTDKDEDQSEDAGNTGDTDTPGGGDGSDDNGDTDTPGDGDDSDDTGNTDTPGDEDTPGNKEDGDEEDLKWRDLIVEADTYLNWNTGYGCAISAQDGMVYKCYNTHPYGEKDGIPKTTVNQIQGLTERGVRFAGALISENGNAYNVNSSEITAHEFPLEGEKVKEVVYYSTVSSNSFRCVLTESGKLYTWGTNRNGEIGNGECGRDLVQETPYLVLENVEKAYEYGNMFAITKDHKLYIWGSNTDTIGCGNDVEPTYSPYLALENVQEIYLSSNYVMALTLDGKLYNWGLNAWIGQGNSQGTQDDRLPCLILENVKKVIKAGAYGAILENGDFYTWMGVAGNINYGQTGHERPYNEPVKILENVVDAQMAEYRGCAYTKTGELYIWGMFNWDDPEYSPIKVMDGVKDAAILQGGILAVKKDGSLWIYDQHKENNPEDPDGSRVKVEFNEQVPVEKTIDAILDIPDNSPAECAPVIAEDGTLYGYYSGHNTESDSDTWEYYGDAIPIKRGIKGVLEMYRYSFTEDGQSRYGIDALIIGQDDSLIWCYATPDGVSTENVCLDKFLLPNGSFVGEEESSGSTDGEDEVAQTNTVKKIDDFVYTESAQGVQQKVYENLYPDEFYNFYVIDKDGMQYISQHKSGSNGEITVKFQPKVDAVDAHASVVRMKKTQMKNVTVTMPQIYSTGEAVAVFPDVSLDGEMLIQGIDYTMSGDCEVSEPGVYQLVIEGLGNYYGSVTVEFTVKDIQDKAWGDLVEEEEKGFDNPQQIPDGLWVKGITEGMSVTYTGKAITFPLQVYDHTKRLVAGKDYTISYKNNKKVADASVVKPSKIPTVTITGKGNYSGRKIYHFSIEKADITKEEFEMDDIIVARKSAAQYPVPVVKWNGKTLKKNVDYKVSYPSTSNGKTAYKDEGTYEIVVSGYGNFTGTRKIALVITNKTLIGTLKYSKIDNQTKVDDTPIEPDLKIYDKDYLLQKNLDYTCEYFHNNEIGMATVNITGKGKYAGSKCVSFKIVGTSIAKATVEGLLSTYEYTGTDMEPDNVELLLNGKKLQKDIDYTISYPKDKNKNVGTVIMQFDGINNYSGSIRKKFKITPYDISKDYHLKVKLYHEGKVFQNVTVSYEKGSTKPMPEIWFSGNKLKQGMDYQVSYKDNNTISDRKIPKIVITGKGNFKGKITREFTITPKDIGELEQTSAIADKVESVKSGVYYSAPTVYDCNGKVLKKGVDYCKDIIYTYAEDTVLADGGLSRKAGEIVEKEDKILAGTVIHATIKGTGNYQGSLTLSYRVAKYDIAKAKVSVEDSIYRGMNLPPTKEQIHLTMVIDGNVRELDKEDFEIVSVQKGTFINKGKYQIVIRGVRGDYGGIKKTSYRIIPKNNWL